MKRIIMHYDMDSFYASIEIKNNPKLKGKPIVVGGGVICTASYEARKYGVKSAMPLFKAKQLCPNLIVVPVNKDLYFEISNQIHKLVKKITDKVEFIALDEGYLDITDIIGKYSSKEYFAKKFKERLKEIIGLTCSVGIGYNKLSAKIASDINKPGGIYIFNNEVEFQKYIEDKPVKIIPGVGKKLENELLKCGIEKVIQIRELSFLELENRYSPSRAHMLYYYSRGIDDSEVESERKMHSIGNENTYKFPLESEESVRKELESLFERVYERIVEERVYCKTIILKIKYSDYTVITRSVSLDKATSSKVVLHDMFENLFSEIEEFSSIKLVGFSVANLATNRYEQLKL